VPRFGLSRGRVLRKVVLFTVIKTRSRKRPH
jgi:hypothetical protein